MQPLSNVPDTKKLWQWKQILSVPEFSTWTRSKFERADLAEDLGDFWRSNEISFFTENCSSRIVSESRMVQTQGHESCHWERSMSLRIQGSRSRRVSSSSILAKCGRLDAHLDGFFENCQELSRRPWPDFLVLWCASELVSSSVERFLSCERMRRGRLEAVRKTRCCIGCYSRSLRDSCS